MYIASHSDGAREAALTGHTAGLAGVDGVLSTPITHVTRSGQTPSRVRFLPHLGRTDQPSH